MHIRAAVPGDIPQIMLLAEHSETAAHWNAREYHALFAPEAPKRVALVAVEEGNSIAGFVIARSGDEEWEIENVVVDPKLRQQGVGRRLIESLVQEAKVHGATAILLEVRESNVAARGLYAKLGFNEQGRRRGYYRDPEEDALVLQIRL